MPKRRDDYTTARLQRWFNHYLGRMGDSSLVMARAEERFPNMPDGRLQEVMAAVAAWRGKRIPRIRMAFSSMMRPAMWPDDYVDDTGEFRVNIGYRDTEGKWQQASLVLNYRDGMSLQEAFDDARAEAMRLIEKSPKLRDLVEEHAAELTMELEPRMGPLPPAATGPTAEF